MFLRGHQIQRDLQYASRYVGRVYGGGVLGGIPVKYLCDGSP